MTGESIDGSTQALDQVASTDLKQVMLVKALLNAHDTLLAELQKLCDAINHAVDLTEFTSKMNDMKLFDSFLQEPVGVGADAEDPAQGTKFGCINSETSGKGLSWSMSNRRGVELEI